MSSSNQQENKEKSQENVQIELQTKLEEQIKLSKEYLDHLQRLQAEFENFQKRVEKEKQEFVKLANADLMEQLIEVLVNFERSNLKDQGINLIYKQFKALLEKNGLEEIKNKGIFDPNFHEVLLKEPSDKEEDAIIEVFEKGYTIHGKLLRPSKVKVSGGKNE